MTEHDDYRDDPPLCAVHGCELEIDGTCDECHLASYESSLTWDADDEVDARTEDDDIRDSYESAA